MITIYFPKYLQTLTNGVESQQFDTDDCQIIISGLRLFFPKLSTYLSHIDSDQIRNLCYFVDIETESLIVISPLTKQIKATKVVFIITIYGQGENGTSFLVGAALIAAGFALGPASLVGISGFLTGGQIAVMGISFVLSGVLGLFNSTKSKAPPNAPHDASVRANNDAFGALQNTTSTDNAIPLIFGHIRVPGQFIGGRIKTVNHDASTVISVANYV